MDLSQFNKEQMKEFLDPFEAIITDVDGVLWIQNNPIPNSIECINFLKDAGKQIRFVSNNNITKPIDTYIKRLQQFGVKNVEEDDLIIPTVAYIHYLKSINFDKELYVIGTAKLKEELSQAGFKIIEDPPSVIEEDSPQAFLTNCTPNDKIGAVIMDWDPNYSLLKLLKAVTYLKQEGVIFIKGGSDEKLPIKDDFFLLGSYYFQLAVAKCSGRNDAIQLAKPGGHLKKFIKEKYDIKDLGRILFIGDSVPADMGFANKCGFKKLLVLSGTTKKEDLKVWKWSEELKPDFYIGRLGQIFEILNV